MLVETVVEAARKDDRPEEVDVEGEEEAETEGRRRRAAPRDRRPVRGDQDRQERRDLRDQPVAERVAAPPHGPEGIDGDRGHGADDEVAGEAPGAGRSGPERGGAGRDREEKDRREDEEASGRAHENAGQPPPEAAGEVGARDILRGREGGAPVGVGVPGMEESGRQRERREGGEAPSLVSKNVESERQRDDDVGRPVDDGERQRQPGDRDRAASPIERPEGDREEENGGAMLEEAAARDAPDGRAEGIDESEEERFFLGTADALQRKVEKEHGERGDPGRRQHREEEAVVVEIHARETGGRVDRHVQDARQHRVVRHDPAADEPEPVGQVAGDELAKIEVVILQQRDGEKLGRHGVSAAEVSKGRRYKRRAGEGAQSTAGRTRNVSGRRNTDHSFAFRSDQRPTSRGLQVRFPLIIHALYGRDPRSPGSARRTARPPRCAAGCTTGARRGRSSS